MVDLFHPECFILLQLCRHASYSNGFGYLWKVYDCLKILVGIQRPFSPKFSYEKITWYMDLTSVLVGNHSCWITGKETRCENISKSFVLLCLHALPRHSTVKSEGINVNYYSPSAIHKKCSELKKRAYSLGEWEERLE